MDLPPNGLAEVCLEDARSVITFRDGVGFECIEELATLARKCLDRTLPVFLDLTEVTFLDTSMIQLLLSLRESCHAKEVAFWLSPPDEKVMRYLNLAGFSDLYPAAREAVPARQVSLDTVAA